MTKPTPPKKTAPKKKTGAKAKGPYENKRAVLTTRITGKTRKALENAAAMSGRSLSQEIEHRLERSFMVEDSLGLVGIHPEIAKLIKTLLDAQWLIEEKTGLPAGDDLGGALALGTAMAKIGRAFSDNKPPSKDFILQRKKQEERIKKRHKASRDKADDPESPSVDELRDSPVIRALQLGDAVASGLIEPIDYEKDMFSSLIERIHIKYIESLKDN